MDPAVPAPPSPSNSKPLFVGDFETWIAYRMGLVGRSQAWHEAHGGKEQLPWKELQSLFPPPAFSSNLAAGSRWRPSSSGVVKHVVVSVGGIFGGFDGPSGLIEYAALVLPNVSFLLLDTGHTLDVAVPVLRTAMQWLLSAYPESSGHVIIAGFSMGSSTAVHVGSEFVAAVRGLLLIAGQSAHTEQITAFAGKPVLLLHGENDPSVPLCCSQALARDASASGALVQLHVVPQATQCAGDVHGKLRKHHLWDERWEVQALVLDWIRQLTQAPCP